MGKITIGLGVHVHSQSNRLKSLGFYIAPIWPFLYIFRDMNFYPTYGRREMKYILLLLLVVFAIAVENF